MTKIKIGPKAVGPGHPCYIIAEAGSNHDGKLEQACQLIDVAADAGADAIKFQLFTAEKIAARTKQDIVKLRDQFGEFGSNLYEMYKKMETPADWFEELKVYSEDKGLTFLTTPFDEDAADFLEAMDVPAVKIASFEMVHIPLLRHVAKFGKPVIISTGMGDLADIEDALAALHAENNYQGILLHCGINYPLEFASVHLAAMDTMRHAFQLPVGYSDHTPGIVVPVAAVARGANMIEKHFTLDKGLQGPDHAFALDPDEFKQMVQAIRDVEAAIGSPIKKMADDEKIYYDRGRRSMFAAVDIAAGVVIEKDMIEILRPGVGLAPKYLEMVVGRKAQTTIEAHEPITWDSI
jgi:sialic acid synthase SpsE